MHSHNSYAPANMFRSHESVILDIDKLVIFFISWRQILEWESVVSGWQSTTVSATASHEITGCIFYRRPYEVLYRAVKGKHWSKTHWCSWQAVPLRVQDILPSWLKRMMSRNIPHSVLVFYCPTESCDSFEGSASFKQYFMFVMHISMSSCALWHFCPRYPPQMVLL